MARALRWWREVRALAQRSSVAARDQELIDESSSRVGVGLGQTQQARQSIDATLAQVEAFRARVDDIDRRTQAQLQGVSQVLDSMSEMDQITQQNAALCGGAGALSPQHAGRHRDRGRCAEGSSGWTTPTPRPCRTPWTCAKPPRRAVATPTPTEGSCRLSSSGAAGARPTVPPSLASLTSMSDDTPATLAR